MTGRTEADMQIERDQVLNCTQEDIRALAEHIKAFMSEEALCVVGNAEMISKSQQIFDTTVQLF